MWTKNYEVSYAVFTVISYFLPLLGENIFLSTQFSFNTRHQVSQQQKITRNIIFLYSRILIHMFLKIKRREEILNRMVEKIPELNSPYFFSQVTLTCPCNYEILELGHTFTRFVSYLILCFCHTCWNLYLMDCMMKTVTFKLTITFQ